MRYRVTFLAGLAVGFIVGTRAGRERYEQMKRLAQQTAQSPAVRKATQAAGAKAAVLTQSAKQKAASRVPRLTETAKSGASKVRGQFSRLPGRHPSGPAAEGEPATVNGHRPAD